ncbi:T9SS type A sorting domain-containing protein [Hoylesella buccalis]|uniref:T9SS type A sorting domain-containing protein n=1 Tax=Hoylesella buccalis TaxID=28127 RepID=UPI001D092304|nr:T9SS type A sorting domain-containing protein [Hoylesella buccalis]MBS5612717.1 T9SS type A sorting domain-containing protein [Hoylesella buccalis]MCB6900854.1 T9SS type A sorting domain-containing protein [Hoylesella buccalis]UEA62840.1 T9SS type A sorting domain-containing protein [Hoylesella buccalis]UWP49873.1 T9SS type A sorting domain-containing protein [Hoylesella buccalis ATCC 35310]
MVKKILSIAFAAALFMAHPLSMQAGQSMEIIENDIQSVSISVSGSVLHVSGANGQVLQVYNVTGVCLMSVKVDSQDKRYELNVPKGCYIVKVGKTVRKISIR